MKKHIRISSSLALFSIFALLSCAETVLSVEETAKIYPPMLVECRNEATCDKNPEHLKAFIENFYKWYLADLQRVQFNKRKNFYKTEQQFLKKLYSPEFYALDRKAYFGHDGQYNSPFCSDTDSFPALCTLYPPDAWLGDPSAHVEEIKEDICKIIVTLPESLASGKTMPSYSLSVRLKIMNGAWRIDNVTDLLPQLRSGILHKAASGFDNPAHPKYRAA